VVCDPVGYLLHFNILFSTQFLYVISFIPSFTIMISLYGVSFLGIAFLNFHLAAAKATPSTPLQFTFPKPSRSDYRFAEGDEVIVEWRPEVLLSEVFLNCTSGELKFDGISSSM
jgi:hypothetical protein